MDFISLNSAKVTGFFPPRVARCAGPGTNTAGLGVSFLLCSRVMAFLKPPEPLHENSFATHIH